MEKLSKRFSSTNKVILSYVDEKTLANFKKGSKGINKILNGEKFYWIRIINKHRARFQEFQESWKKVISRTPVDTIKQLALAVDKFFQGKPTRLERRWHPLFIAAEQGSLELCKHIIYKTGCENPKRMKDGLNAFKMAT